MTKETSDTQYQQDTSALDAMPPLHTEHTSLNLSNADLPVHRETVIVEEQNTREEAEAIVAIEHEKSVQDDANIADNHVADKDLGETTTHKNFKRNGRLKLYYRRFMRRPSAVVGVVIFIFLILFAMFGSHLSSWAYDEPDFANLGTPPSADHLLGTTTGGSDMLALVARGLGRSLAIGILSSVATTIIAAIIGTSIAFFEGVVETVGMWILDCLLVIPSFLLIAVIVRSSSGTSGWIWLTFGLTVFGWVGYARVLRTLTMSLRELEYVRAARFMGDGSFSIIVRHLIPNLGSVLIINTMLGIVGAVNSETALSFLGLGIKAPDTSLGTLLQAGQSTVLTAPWILLVPSAVLILLTFSVQLIGDGLRDAIDPNSRSGGKAQ